MQIQLARKALRSMSYRRGDTEAEKSHEKTGGRDQMPKNAEDCQHPAGARGAARDSVSCRVPETLLAPLFNTSRSVRK